LTRQGRRLILFFCREWVGLKLGKIFVGNGSEILIDQKGFGVRRVWLMGRGLVSG
jgi:hypothetical protein